MTEDSSKDQTCELTQISQSSEHEVTKEVLAPAEGQLRNNLISTAVAFLTNERIKSSPLTQKINFLGKKGLTKEEIQIALERAGIRNVDQSLKQYQSPAFFEPQTNQMIPQVVNPLPSRWQRAKSATTAGIIIAGLSYALYITYQKYVQSWLLGKSMEEKRLEQLESATRQLQETLQAVRQSLDIQHETLTVIHDSLSQRQKDDTVIKYADVVSLNEVKAEIASLKGLLLSSRQFPPTPSTSPVVPYWQRQLPVSGVSSSESLLVPNSPAQTYSPSPSTSLSSVLESNSNTSIRNDPHKMTNGELEKVDEELKEDESSEALLDDIGEAETELSS